MNWKKTRSATHITLSIYLLVTTYRTVISFGSESFVIDLVLNTITILALFLHYFYLKRLNSALDENSLSIRELQNSENAAYFGLILYAILLLEIIAGVATTLIYNVYNTQFYSFSIITATLLVTLIFLMLRSVKIRKASLAQFSKSGTVGFFGTWKSATVLILLGFIKLVLMGITDIPGLFLVLIGLIRLIRVSSKK